MNLNEFLSSIESSMEPPNLRMELQALWWVKKGDWEKAHGLAQNAGTKEGDWIHAHLHRAEGDLGNATYWYARSGRPVSHQSLKNEWMDIVTQILEA